jgi:GTP-binding protein
MVDVSSADAVDDLDTVYGEVAAYDDDLAARARVIVANKTDLGGDAEPVAAWARSRNARFVAISAADAVGLDELRTALIEEVAQSKAERGDAVSFAVYRPAIEDRIIVYREDDAFRVRSERVERAVAQTPMDSPRAVRRMQRHLRSLGVEKVLRREGANDGDEVRIGEVAFEWIPEDA